MRKYIQSGKNDIFPEIIEVWKFGEQPIPDWISDRCKVKFIDGLGNITLDYRETNIGGVEFISADSSKVAFSMKSKRDCVCWGDRKLFILNETQLNLLYREIKK